MSKRSKVIAIIITAIILLALACAYLYWTGAFDRFMPCKVLSLSEYNASVTIAVEPEEYVPNLILVNKQYTLAADYQPDIVYYRDTDVLMGSAIVEAYGELSDYIRNELKDRLYVSSTYRSYEEQARVLEEEGADVAANPGESEHQTGLAVDLYVMEHAGMGFLNSEAGKYVNEHCSEYGFIIRYPNGRKAVTGFDYEPWHIRFVGHPHADIISEFDITLEEYIEFFEVGKWYRYGDYVIGMTEEDDIRIPSEFDPSEMLYSRDNRGHVFVWGKIA